MEKSISHLSEELRGLLIVSDLGELERDSTLAVLRSLCRLNGILHSLYQSIGILTGGLSVGDADDQERLAHLTAVQLLDEDGIHDLLAQFYP
jgi:glucose uptake protein GlcU